MQVLKANGEKEDFSEDKVIRSIQRAGIALDLQPEVANHIKDKLYDNIPTSEIYHHITEYLGTSKEPYAKSKYGLKQAIMSLGPTGYPFEDFVAALLKSQGYQTEVRQFLRGKCVNHEIDVIARKDDKAIMVEAKFHNNIGTRSEVHVSLYTKARFDDIKEKHGLTEGWIVTNTKATLDAIAYATCENMKIISWSYPQEGSLRDMIERSHLHPVTILASLSHEQKLVLLENHIVMCQDILKDPTVLTNLHLSDEQKSRTLDEASYIDKTGSNAA